MSDNEIITIEPERQLARMDNEWTADQVVAQVHKVQEVMKRVMEDGVHYGKIPGCDKPSLLKPGAEKLCMTFRLAPHYEVTRTNHPGGHVEFEVNCELRNIQSGVLVGSGVGSCSSLESKYRWRTGTNVCPRCGKSAIIKGKDEYGGGWLCWTKKQGCNAKFPESAFTHPEREENPDIADQINTVLKMAKKRAFVDATITATAASDIFTQDMEDTHQAEPSLPPNTQTEAKPYTGPAPKTSPPPNAMAIHNAAEPESYKGLTDALGQLGCKSRTECDKVIDILVPGSDLKRCHKETGMSDRVFTAMAEWQQSGSLMELYAQATASELQKEAEIAF